MNRYETVRCQPLLLPWLQKWAKVNFRISQDYSAFNGQTPIPSIPLIIQIFIIAYFANVKFHTLFHEKFSILRLLIDIKRKNHFHSAKTARLLNITISSQKVGVFSLNFCNILSGNSLPKCRRNCLYTVTTNDKFWNFYF